MQACYFYSPSRYDQTKAETGTGESRYLHDAKGDAQAYTHQVSLYKQKWQQHLRVGETLSPDMAEALRIYGIPADAMPVFIGDSNCRWGILITNPAAYDRQPEHAYMHGGPLPTREDKGVSSRLLALAA